MFFLRLNPFRFILFLSIFVFFVTTFGAAHVPDAFRVSSGFRLEEGELGGLIPPWEMTRRFLADATVDNSSLLLAEDRTRRKDPLDGLTRYNGGWNISNSHYWASVGFTAAPFFVIALIWFVVFGLSLSLICLCYCCCSKEPYGYSRTAYALSLILLILFTIAAIVGCVVLYTGQGRFHSSTTSTLGYVVQQADVTVENLKNVSDYLGAAKRIGVDAVFLPSEVQNNIDQIETKINSSATTLSDKTEENSKEIQNVLDSVRLALVIVAAIMLFLAFLGFLFSIFGLRTLVYILVVVGWILVAGTFILCGVFLLLHNVVADACVAMDEWVQNPTAHTALDDILPCVDNATAQETLLRSRDVTYQLVKVVDTVVSNVTNLNNPPKGLPFYFNQSGPMMPTLCNPFNSDLSTRQCEAGEVHLNNATKVWQNYVCKVNSDGNCATTGRLTPTIFDQMAAAVNVSYGLYRYGPFLVDLQDCTFVRNTFTDISNKYCPGLRRHSQWIYIGLVMVSAAVMLSLIFWVIYARERKHRVYTKQLEARAAGGDPSKAA
ncbi:uncharacterized protein LOC133782843 [Humulus lupulus]|uniref:uncharacterized protein LOC133782843 n=1 Tax=Humulus lupulus TaxID=3486 RepID=UPI002B40A1A9|nr:uncharacterized protein LOC133782843 [Humulus lupulus]